jgi:hypothetical protein
VHRVVLWTDDGHTSKTYYGLDSTNSSSRFALLGSAKVNPYVSMGFEIMIEIEAGGTSSKVSQLDEDGRAGGQVSSGTTSFNASNTDAYRGDARRVAWWIEHKDIGRLTVGRTESAGAVTTIDLAGIAPAASGSMILVNGGFLLRNAAGDFGAISWGALGDPASNQGRTELIRYDSPTIAGFIASASIGEAGDYWGAMLRYAGEFSGIRIAAGIGYENITDRQTNPACFGLVAGAAANAACAAGTGAGPANLDAVKPDVDAWGASLALMHVPTGLFVQGHYMAVDYNAPGNAGNSGYWGQVANKKDADQWLVQAGIAKNWTGLGNTVIYGEYSRSNDFGAGTGAGRDYNIDPATGAACVTGNTTPGGAGGSAIPGAASICDVTSTELTVWGVGLVQNIDAAAATLYLSWRHFSADITADNAVGVQVKGSPEDFDAVIGGAVVRF